MKMMYSEPLVKLLTGKGAFGDHSGPFGCLRSIQEPPGAFCIKWNYNYVNCQALDYARERELTLKT